MPRRLTAAAAAFSITLGGFVVASAAHASPLHSSTFAAKGPAATGQSAEASGSATWGLKQSFRNYIKNGPAQGSIEPGDGASGEFNFPLDSGQAFDAANPGTLRFKGSVHFTGHHGQLDVTIANPVVSFTSATTGVLRVDVKSKAMGANEVTDYGQVEFATLSGLQMNDAEGGVSLSASTVKLTAAGAQGFAGFYREGEDLDSFTFNLAKQRSGQQAPDAEPSSQQQPAAGPSNELPKGSDEGRTSSNGDQSEAVHAPAYRDANPPAARVQSNSVPQSAAARAPVPAVAPPVSIPASVAAKAQAPQAKGNKAAAAPASKPLPQAQCTADASSRKVTQGNFGWGLRKSFTTYIRSSIAKGSWNLSGAAWDGSNFNFPASGGLFNTASKQGKINYSGSVHFTGHNGLLDMTIGNPTLQINGNSGVLSMSVSSSDTSGKKTDYGVVPFANVKFANVSASSTSLNYTSSSVTLTSQGAKAFAGFYKDGESLDNLSGSAALTPTNECDPGGGAGSGADGAGADGAGGAGGGAGSGADGAGGGADGAGGAGSGADGAAGGAGGAGPRADGAAGAGKGGGKGGASALPRTGAEADGFAAVAFASVVAGGLAMAVRRRIAHR